MAVEKSYARLGLFILVALVVVLATAVLFIQRMRNSAVIALVTYTTENISGLDVSSPVRFRGVFIGRVTDVRVDPRGSIIEIDFDLFVDRLNEIGTNVKMIRAISDFRGVFPTLRARLVGNPVTGEAYLLLDRPENPPPPFIDLRFTPRRPYVPMMPSPLTAVQDRLPELLDRTEATLQTLREIVTRIPNSLDRSDRFLTHVERIMQAESAGSQKFMTTTSGQIGQITSQLDRVIGTAGALVKFSEEARAAIKDADFPGTAQSTRDAAESSKLAADDLRRSLPTIRDSLEQMRDLARHLDEEPESVVYGPRPQHGKH